MYFILIVNQNVGLIQNTEKQRNVHVPSKCHHFEEI